MRIKSLRHEFGYTQEELGKKIGQTKSNISKYENGVLEPGIDTLRELAKLFDVSLDYLTSNSDIRNPYKDYPKSTELINFARKIAKENGYDLTGKTNEEIAQLILKGLKVEDINK